MGCAEFLAGGHGRARGRSFSGGQHHEEVAFRCGAAAPSHGGGCDGGQAEARAARPATPGGGAGGAGAARGAGGRPAARGPGGHRGRQRELRGRRRHGGPRRARRDHSAGHRRHPHHRGRGRMQRQRQQQPGCNRHRQLQPGQRRGRHGLRVQHAGSALGHRHRPERAGLGHGQRGPGFRRLRHGHQRCCHRLVRRHRQHAACGQRIDPGQRSIFDRDRCRRRARRAGLGVQCHGDRAPRNGHRAAIGGARSRGVCNQHGDRRRRVLRQRLRALGDSRGQELHRRW